jgi:hypothetical protein
MAKTIKPYEAYGNVSDGQVVTIGTIIQTAMTGNFNFPNPPVDLVVLKTDIDQFSTLIVEAQDGSKKVTAEKNKQLDVVVRKLRLLGRYVEVHCNNDMAIFKSSGFEPVSTSRNQPQGLSPNIRSIDHGANSGQIVVRLKAVPQAVSYELRCAAEGNGATAPAWMTEVVISVRTPVTIDGLTPGIKYAFQVRSLGKSGYSDWSDSVTFMCT